MPILFIHGVAVRDDEGWPDVRGFLHRYVTPVLSADSESVPVEFLFWGDLGALARHGGTSRPRSSLLRQGADAVAPDSPITAAELVPLFDRLGVRNPPPRSAGGLISSGARSAASGGGARPPRPSTLSAFELSNFLATIIDNLAGPADRSRWKVAADFVAYDPVVRKTLADAESFEAELQLLQDVIEKRLEQEARAGLIAQGPSRLGRLGDRVGEALSRGWSGPGFAASRLLGEVRPPVHARVVEFFGDVFTYLAKRGRDPRPGEIPARVLLKLDQVAADSVRRKEPLVVLTHSMGGQIVYDLVSHFLPATRSNIRIDFWCAAASQVGLFEELSLFLESKGGTAMAAFPTSHLGYWWNVWDPNDFISFTANGIVEGVDDESFNCGMSLLGAHSGYFTRPTFFRRLGEKIAAAKKNDWRKRADPA